MARHHIVGMGEKVPFTPEEEAAADVVLKLSTLDEPKASAIIIVNNLSAMVRDRGITISEKEVYDLKSNTAKAWNKNCKLTDPAFLLLSLACKRTGMTPEEITATWLKNSQDRLAWIGEVEDARQDAKTAIMAATTREQITSAMQEFSARMKIQLIAG